MKLTMRWMRSGKGESDMLQEGCKGGILVFIALSLCPLPAYCDQAISADSFVDTAGVNIHLSWIGTPYYDDYPSVLSALKGLGVRHTRDGLSDLGLDPTAFYYQRHDDLARAGISTIYDTPINESATMLLAYPGLVKDFEGYEGPNEYDRSGDPNWAADLTAYQKFLYETVKTNPTTAKYPVLAPALVDQASWPQVSGLVSSMDFGNLHNYFAGFNPGTTGSYSIATAIQNLHAGWPKVPIITTETGYIYQTFLHIVGAVGGSYLPRVLLEQYLNGIRRTYIYELVDKDATEYGLIQADMTPRAAYTAMASLLHLLSDPGPTFASTSLNFSISGDTSNVHHLLMQKRNGSFYLALWIESQDYDQLNQADINVPNQEISLLVPGTDFTPIVHEFDSSGNISSSVLASGASFPLSVSPNVVIVQIMPGASFSMLSTVATPSAGGWITVSPVSVGGTYQSTQTVTVEASTHTGYTFAGSPLRPEQMSSVVVDRRNARFEKESVKHRTLSNGIAFVWTACIALAASAGCAHSMLAGIFVNRDNRVEVDMLRLVESPRGHLSGSLVVSSLDANGSRKEVAVHDVTGTMSGANVSLQLEGGLAGLAEFLGASTNLVGNLKGRTLTLSAGNQTEVFREVAQKEYGDALANLDKVGQQASMVRHAAGALQEAKSGGEQLNADLKSYIGWGQQRIDHVRMVRQWYADRIEAYTKCLRTISPLAASGVPSWRWQDCVLTIQNDGYHRDQEAQSIRDFQRQNHDAIAGIDARINATQRHFSNVLDAVRSACPYAKDVEACEKELQKDSLPPDGFLDSQLIASYKSIVPQVSAAIIVDTQTVASGQSSLSSIAQQVDKVYRSAR
jgi:hypothetical protein